ncbi:hypothetical protein [[Mycoplasma] gypis]|uniref:ECM-binding protein homolog n=1 Tax=[Mycoplasma] gypis TaxID=92404 RepID=A0ABZ2RUZ2_9BACT|nr:hypothetical protein [[Mycoplasma] gypis]MBN0919409.1 hypothetical protein [[Mycoplasma] gypis]
MEQKKNRAYKALGSVSFIAGLLGFGAAGWLIGLHQTNKEIKKEVYVFSELNTAFENLDSFLESEDSNILTKEQKANLEHINQYAKQLLDNPSSSIEQMLKQRNIIKLELAKAKLLSSNDENFDKNLQDYISLVKENDLFTDASNFLANKDFSTGNKQQKLQELFNEIDPLIQTQNDLSLDLETKAWTLHENILRNRTPYENINQKAAVLELFNNTINLINQSSYSRDLLIETQNSLNEELSAISKEQDKIQAQQGNFLKFVKNLQNEIQGAQVSQQTKQKALDKINELIKQAQSSEIKYAATKVDEINYLTSVASNILKNIDKFDLPEEDIQNQISQKIEEINSQSYPEQIADFSRLMIDKINTNKEQKPSDKLQELEGLENIVNTLNNIKTNILKNLDLYEQQDLITLDYKQEILSNFNLLLVNNESEQQPAKNASEVLQEATKIFNNVNNTALVAKMYKKSLSEVLEQVQWDLEDGFGVDKLVLSQDSQKLDDLINNKKSVAELNQGFQEISERLRQTNKQELKRYIDWANAIINSDDAKISQKTKVKLSSLNLKSQKFVVQDSTATRDELQYFIKQYRVAYIQSQMDESLANADSVAQKALEDISKAFPKGSKKSPYNSDLENDINNLKNKAQIIALDPKLSKEEKESQLKALENKMKAIAAQAEGFSQLEKTVNDANLALETSDGDKDEISALDSQISRINELKKQAAQALNDPENSNPQQIQDELKKAIEEFKDAQAKYQSTAGFDDVFKKINNTFAPDMKDNEPTPTQQKLLDKLSELKSIVADPSLPKAQRDEARRQMRELAESVEISRELEIANNNLKTLIDLANEQDYGNYRPNDAINHSKNVNNDINTYLQNINSNGISKVSEYQEKLNKVNKERNDLLYEISAALLRKAVAQLQIEKYDGPNIEKQPYASVNNNIDNIVNDANRILNLSYEQRLKSTDIDTKEAAIRKQTALAHRSKLALEQLDTLNEKQNPEAYSNLRDVISENLIILNDSDSNIDTKIKLITDEMEKTQARNETHESLLKLKDIYTDHDRLRDILNTQIENFDNRYVEFERQINERYISIPQLRLLKFQIENYNESQKELRVKTIKEYDNAVAYIESLKQVLAQNKTEMNVTDSHFSDAVFRKFDVDKDKFQDGRYPTLTSDILAYRPKISLAWYQDLYTKKSNETKAKIQSTHRLQNFANLSDELVAKNLKAVEEFDKKIALINNPSDINVVKNYIDRLRNLDLFINQQNDVVDYMNDKKDDEINQISVNNLKTALEESKFDAEEDEDYALISSEDIRIKRVNLYDEYINNVSLQEAKDYQKSKIDEYRSEINEKLDALTTEDDLLKEKINNFLDGLKIEVQEVSKKSEIFAINSKLDSFKDKESTVINLAKAVKKAQVLETTENQKDNLSNGETTLLEMIQAEINASQDMYIASEETDLSKKTEDINLLIEQYNLLVDTQNGLNEIKELLNPVEYPAGNVENRNTDSKTKFEAYLTNLQNKLDQNPQDKIIVSTVKSLLGKVKELINKQKLEIQRQAEILADESFKNVSYTPENETTDYGFEKDAKNYADVIMDSVPELEDSLDKIENDLIPNLEKKSFQTKGFYEKRKHSLEVLLKDDSQGQQGYKIQQKNKISSSEQSSILPIYEKLWIANNIFYHDLANNIKDANSQENFNNDIAQATLINNVFADYMEIAQRVSLGKQKIESLSSESESVRNNKYVQASVEKLNQEIEQDEAYYYTQKNKNRLVFAKNALDNYRNRIELAVKVAKLTEQLNAISTNVNDDGFLTVEDKIPLQAIIDYPFKDLEANPQKEVEAEYIKYMDIYLDGNSIQGFQKSLEDSIILRRAENSAKKFVNSYKEHKNDFDNYEITEMIELYGQLESKLAEANAALSDLNHDEPLKIQLNKAITNGNDGIVDRLLKVKNEQISQIYIRNILLDKLMQSNYPDDNYSPRLSDYKSVGVTPLQTSVETPEEIVDLNQKMKVATEKYNEQYQAIWTWEKNRYDSYKEKFQPYYELLMQDSDELNASLKRDISGISQALLNKFSEITLATGKDSDYGKANEYIKESQSNPEEFQKQLISNAKEIIGAVIKAGTDLKSLFQRIVSTSVSKLLVDKSQFKRFLDQFQVSENHSFNIREVLKEISALDQLQEKINDFNEQATQLGSLQNSDIQNVSSEATLTFDTPTSQKEDITQERQTYFNHYKTFVESISKTRLKLNELIYGSNAVNNEEETQTTSDDNNNLRFILNKFINGNDTYTGRADFTKFSENLLKNSNDDVDVVFKQAKFNYDKLGSLSKLLVSELDKLVVSKTNVSTEYINLVKAYEQAFAINKWFNTTTNTDLLFTYLGNADNGTYRYAQIKPLNSASAESFQDEIESERNQTEITFNSVTYKAKEITNNEALLKMFEDFNIIKGQYATKYKTDNIKVYAIRSNTEDSKFSKLQLQSDTTIKKAYINLLFVYTKPENLNVQNTAFSNVQTFGIKYDSVPITFKTFDNLKLDKTLFGPNNLFDPAPGADNSNVIPLFKDNWAGWKNTSAPVNFMGSFIKYTMGILQEQNKDYFTENIDEDIDTKTPTLSDSSEKFRIKLKMKENAEYKGYKQVGNEIYWKTQNPNFVSYKGIEFQSGGAYLNSQFEYSRAMGSMKNPKAYPFVKDYLNTEAYIYRNASDSKRENDKGKVMLFLPINIVVPVQKDNGEYAAMVINWRWLTRFDESYTEKPQDIYISNEDLLRNVYFFEPKPGNTENPQVNNAQNLAKYVASKIKYREFVKYTFDNIKPESGLWTADPLVKRNDVGKEDNYRGGIGHQDFIDALDKLDISIKLH